MELILLTAAILYVILVVFLKMGLARASRIDGHDSYEPTISIIVPARNEEAHLGECLRSLTEIDYPKDKLQVIIVNDGSLDRTKEIAEDIVRRYSWMELVNTRQSEGNLKGKSNALSAGIDASRGEILMFTDADCTVLRSWAHETARYFDEGTGVVGGYTLLDANRPFEGVQALDWIFLFGLAASTAGWNIPLTVIGNNLAVRRSAYAATGGYRNIPFSVTEDYALVQAMLEKSRIRVRFPVNPRTLVNSKPCQTWKQLYRQKQRWGVGGLEMVFWGMVIMSIGWAFRLAIILSCFLGAPGITLAAAVCLGLSDLYFLWMPLRRFGRLNYLKYFLPFELYFSVYVLLIPIVAKLSKNVVWKERKL
jgi:cellulose synthase/poly-beta-1,6-N-acetylglucosamine synthase-like glycosyltransferase